MPSDKSGVAIQRDNEGPWTVARIGEHVRIKQDGEEVYIPIRMADEAARQIKEVRPNGY